MTPSREQQRSSSGLAPRFNGHRQVAAVVNTLEVGALLKLAAGRGTAVAATLRASRTHREQQSLE